MQDVYKSIEEYNLGKKRNVLIVFEDMIAYMISNNNLNRSRADNTGRAGGHAPLPPFYLHRKKKKRNKGKKERVSKQKLLKGCHQGQNIIVLPILECLEFKKFFCRPTRVAGNTFQCSMPNNSTS